MLHWFIAYDLSLILERQLQKGRFSCVYWCTLRIENNDWLASSKLVVPNKDLLNEGLNDLSKMLGQPCHSMQFTSPGSCCGSKLAVIFWKDISQFLSKFSVHTAFGPACPHLGTVLKIDWWCTEGAWGEANGRDESQRVHEDVAGNEKQTRK